MREFVEIVTTVSVMQLRSSMRSGRGNCANGEQPLFCYRVTEILYRSYLLEIVAISGDIFWDVQSSGLQIDRLLRLFMGVARLGVLI